MGGLITGVLRYVIKFKNDKALRLRYVCVMSALRERYVSVTKGVFPVPPATIFPTTITGISGFQGFVLPDKNFFNLFSDIFLVIKESGQRIHNQELFLYHAFSR